MATLRFFPQETYIIEDGSISSLLMQELNLMRHPAPSMSTFRVNFDSS